MTPEEKYELFEKKINDALSSKEQEEFSQIIRSGKSVAEEFRMYKEWTSYLNLNLSSEAKQEQSILEQNLKKMGDLFFDKKSSTKEVKVMKIPSWAYAVAASVAIILGVYTFTKNEPVYSDFASIPVLSITERGSEDGVIKEAEAYFNAKKYAEAENYLSDLLKNNKTNSEYLFYYGITLVEQDKHKDASEVFSVLQGGNSIYKHRAIWFEALNQLKKNNKDRCAELLKTIPKEAEDYSQAQKLLGKL